MLKVRKGATLHRLGWVRQYTTTKHTEAEGNQTHKRPTKRKIHELETTKTDNITTVICVYHI